MSLEAKNPDELEPVQFSDATRSFQYKVLYDMLESLISAVAAMRNYVWDDVALDWVRMKQPLLEIIGGNFTLEMGEVETLLTDIKGLVDGVEGYIDGIESVLEQIKHGSNDEALDFSYTGDEMDYIQRSSDGKKLNLTWVGGKLTHISDWT